jgi:predicted murein hydrolase (TIGR00659 family)
MDELYRQPVFGVFLTLLAFYVALAIRKRSKNVLLNPVLVAVSLIILVLISFDISFDDYNEGGKFLTFFLGPSVVALGVLFYEKFNEIKHNFIPFFISVFIGGSVAIISVAVIAIMLHAPEVITRSLASKSVTTPIAVEVTQILKGIPSITAGVVIAVGIFGNAFGPAILKVLGIRSKHAMGTALGTAAHGIGTARALEEGELTGAYSGLAMCVNGIITAFAAPYVTEWILKMMI